MESATIEEEHEVEQHSILVDMEKGHQVERHSAFDDKKNSSEKDLASLSVGDPMADVDSSSYSNQLANGGETNEALEELHSVSYVELPEGSPSKEGNFETVNGTNEVHHAPMSKLLKAKESVKQVRECHLPAEEDNLNSSEELANLRKQLQQSIIAQVASEELTSKLRAAVLSAEQRAEEASMELIEVRRKLEEELKARDKKYSELDVKFGKLQKRAKQRIQEMQKEKEDIEVQLAAESEKASQALSQCTSLQHDLERVRAQAGDALRSIDAERQQLRSTNNKQKEIIEELQHKLEARDQELKEAQLSTLEKEQVLNELTGKMMEMEESQGVLVADLASKHQKLVADLESQLRDAVQERIKSTDSVASLQTELAKKEAYIAELDTASSGEVIRLTAALDSSRAELVRVEEEHGKEKALWAAALQATKLKLEDAEKTLLQQEMLAAKEKSQLESELQGLRQALSLAHAETLASKEQVAMLEKEFSAYKIRAHSLLQKKEAELYAAKDVEQLAAQEAALRDAQKLATLATAERDHAIKSLKEATVQHESQLAARNVALMDAQQKIRELAAKLEAAKARLLVEEESWQNRLDDVNRTWQEKYNIIIEKNTSKIAFEQEIVSLKEKYTRIQGEHDSFQEMANKMLESKDQEIARLLEEARELQKIISDAPKVLRDDSTKVDRDFEENHLSVGEQQILMLARKQAQREEQLSQCQRHIQALQDEIVELEHENRLHAQQEAALKEELRSLERSQKREGVDMTYLKNVIVKLLETGEVEALLPVVATLLQFSREELKKCREVYNVVPEAPAAGAPPTLFSRFLFSKAGK